MQTSIYHCTYLRIFRSVSDKFSFARLTGDGDNDLVVVEEGLAWETEGEEESVEKAEKDIGLLGSASRKLVSGMGRPSGLPCRTKTYEDKVHKFSTKPSAIKQ